MNHSEVNARMGEYLEGELALKKRALFDAHIDRCESCRQEFVELRETIALLHALPDPEPPPFLAERVIRRIRDGEGRTSLLDRARDLVASLAAPRVAVPATALLVGLLMANGNIDPRGLGLPGLGGEAAPQAAPPGRGQLTIRQYTPSEPGGGPVAPDRRVVRRFASELDRALVMRSAAPPPAIARVPRITIQIPGAGAGDVGPLVTRWPQPSPSRRVPYRQVASPPQLHAEGFMPAGTSKPASALTADFGILAPETAREQRKQTELASRLARLLSSPILYSVEFANLTVAEQEIWLEALAEYAVEVERGDEAVRRLRNAKDRRADELATAFSTQLRLVEADHRREVASLAEPRPENR